MKKIISPLNPGMQDPVVVDLQYGLSLLIDNNQIELSDKERDYLLGRLKDEQGKSYYGETTAQLVALFRKQHDLGDAQDVDEKAADVLNGVLDQLGAFKTPIESNNDNPFVVSGVVRDSGGNLLSGVVVRAYMREIGADELLIGETQSKDDGSYAIPYDPKLFRRGTEGSVQVRVTAVDGAGKEQATKADIFKLGSSIQLDLTLPAAPPLAEWSRLDQAIRPVLTDHGKDGKPLDPTELNDSDIEVLAKDTSIDQGKIRLWVEAFKLAQTTKLLGDDPQSNQQESAIYYGWFRQDLPVAYDEFMKLPTDDLINSFVQAVDQKIIAANLRELEPKLREALENRVIDDTLLPAKEGQPATLGNVLMTMPAPLIKEQQRAVATVLREVTVTDPQFRQRLDAAGLKAPQIAAVERTLRLSELTGQNVPLVAALQSKISPTAPATLESLASINRSEWLELALLHDVPPASDLSVADYANQLAQTVEQQFPTGTFRERLKQGAVTNANYPVEKVVGFLVNNPDFDLRSTRVADYLAEKQITDEELHSGLVGAQRLHALSADADEKAILLDRGITAATTIARSGLDALKRKVGTAIPEARQTEIYNKAVDLHTRMLAITASMSPRFDMTGTRMLGMMPPPPKNLDGNYANLRALFGDLDYCECLHCESVLSPAAYLADLLHLLETWSGSNDVPVLDMLQQRRPDILDIQLSCDNTETELPYIDLVLEVLENSIAFPVKISLESNLEIDIDAELTTGRVPDVVKKVLKKTSITIGDHLTSRLLNEEGQNKDWLLTDNSRVWGVRYKSLRLWKSESPESLQEFRPVPVFSNIASIIDDLNQGILSSVLKSAVFPKSLPDLARFTIMADEFKMPSLGITRRWIVEYELKVFIKINYVTNLGSKASIQALGVNNHNPISVPISLSQAKSISTELQSNRIDTVLNIFKIARYPYDVIWHDQQQQWEFSYVSKLYIADTDARDEFTLTSLTYQASSLSQDLLAAPENRNPAAYDRLASDESVFPWSLPFNLWLEEIRVFLNELGVSRSYLLDLAHSPTKFTNIVAVREILGLSKTESDLICASIKTPEPWRFWGLQELKNSFLDRSDGTTINGTWLDVLGQRVSIVLQQSGLTYRELCDILQIQFPANTPAPVIYSSGECQPSQMTFEDELTKQSTLSHANLDWIHKFVRLWKKVGWTIRNLDRAIQLFGDRIDQDTLTGLALLSRLQSKLDLPLQNIIAMVGGLNTQAWKANTFEGTPILPSIYDLTFQRPILRSNPDFDFFSLDAAAQELAYLQKSEQNPNPQLVPLTNHSAFIAIALGIQASDVGLLVNPDPNSDPDKGFGVKNELKWSNLSLLFSISQLAHAFHLSIGDLVRLVKITGVNPFIVDGLQTTWQKTEAFLKLFDHFHFVQNSKFTLSELDYLLQHRTPTEDDANDLQKHLIQILSDLRSALQTGSALENLSLENLERGLEQLNLKQTIFGSVAQENWQRNLLKVQIDIVDYYEQTPPEIPASLSQKFFFVVAQFRLRLGCIGIINDTDFYKLFKELPQYITQSNVQDLKIRYQLVQDILLSQLQFFHPPEFVIAMTPEIWNVLPNIPADLSNFLSYDVTTHPINLKFSGLMTEEHMSWFEANLPELWPAISELYFNQIKSFQPEVQDLLQSNTEARQLFHEPDSNTRIQMALLRLVPYLERNLINSCLGAAFSLDGSIVDNMLLQITVKNRTAKAVLTESAFIGSDIRTPIDGARWLDQIEAIIRMDKMARFVTHLSISKNQLDWLQSSRFQILDIANLPVKSSNRIIFSDWCRFVELFQLRDVLTNGQAVITALLNSTNEIASQEVLAHSFGLPVADVSTLSGGDFLAMTWHDDYRNPHRLLEATQLLHVIQQMGTTANVIQQLVSEVPTEADSSAARRIFTSQFNADSLPERLRPISDRLRDRQRNALVDYLVAQNNLRDANDLFEFYLIDVQMGSCMMTSRIKQAISSVQLFVQRCLLNLEKPGVLPQHIGAEWKWMKYYRVWEANRKVFLYPENWIEPELRDDKSEQFRALESDLMQSDLTHTTAVEGIRKYLDRLAEIVRLTIVSLYEEMQLNDDSEIIHIVARDTSQPYRYYYRRWLNPNVKGGTWTPWEQIAVQVDSNYVMGFTLSGIMHIAWPSFSKNDTEGSWNYSLKLAKRTASGWTSSKQSDDDQTVILPRLPNKSENETFIFRTNPQSSLDDLDSKEIYCWGGQDFDQSVVTKEPNIIGNYKIYRSYTNIKEESQSPDPAFEVKQKLNLNIGVWEKYVDLEGAIFYKEMLPTDFHMTLYIEASYHLQTPRSGKWQWVTRENKFIRLEIQSERLSGDGDLWGNLTRISHLSPNTVIDEPSGVATVDGTLTTYGPFKLPINDNGSNGITVVIKRVSLTIVPKNHDYLQEQITLSQEMSDLGEGYWHQDIVFTRNNALPIPSYYRSDRKLLYAPLATFKVRGDFSILYQKMKTQPPHYPLSAPPDETDYFASGYRNEVNHQSVMLPRNTTRNESLLFVPSGRFFIVSDPTERFWALQHSVDKPNLIIHLNTNSQWQIVPQSHPWLGWLRNFVKENISQLAPLPQDVSETYFWLDRGSWNSAPVDTLNSDSNVNITFKTGLPWNIYNWETFFHAPLLVATQLSKNQRFEEAQRWFHLLFDPTTSEVGDETIRYWKFKPFRDSEHTQSIEEQLRGLAQGNTSLSTEIESWKRSPFQPHLIARTRIRAYQFTVVLKYLENLIAWGDQLFRRDTIESINEATQLYALASKILGRRPSSIPHNKEIGSLTYRELVQSSHEGHLDDFSNAWIDFESLLASGNSNGSGGISPLKGENKRPVDLLGSLGSLYFCVPNNDKLMSYWDTVEDRLFKIRSCMNIEGVIRQLPLFEPPIDPALLVRAAAAGLDLESILSDLHAPLPKYRFNIMLQKALELAGELKTIGSSLLSALEKGEAEHLALLRSSHEIDMLQLVKSIREQQEQEAEANLVSLRQSRLTIEERYRHYQLLLGKTEIVVPSEGQTGSTEGLQLRLAKRSIWEEENGLSMIQAEQDQLARLSEAQILSMISSGFHTAAGLLGTIAAATSNSVLDISSRAMNFYGEAIGMFSSNASQWAQRSAIIAGYERRRDEWVLQSNLAIRELAQIDKQIIATEIRRDIAKQELANHLKQIENAHEVDTYMRSKYTNEQLYRWMVGEISALYFHTYQLAYDTARRAQKAYEFELGVSNISFVQYGYWDSLKKGLLAGEHLFHDLKRMDLSYLEHNKREYEILQHVSLLQLDPVALITLRQTGQCEIKIPEAYFDLHYPGHYLRRIKSVSISIPCVTGPYASVNCTLTLLGSSVRHQSNGSYERQGLDDSRFADYLGQQSVVTSSGQNDSGLFETNLRDERYLPFEGTGVISNWRIELPKDFRQFDYDTISDVILHLRYTAQEGGIPLRTAAVALLKDQFKEAVSSPLVRGFSLRHEFPTEWYRFVNSADYQSMSLKITKEHFPFIFQSKMIEIKINKIELYVKIAYGQMPTVDKNTLKLTLVNDVASNSSQLLQLEQWLEPQNNLLRAENTFTASKSLGTWILDSWRQKNDSVEQVKLDTDTIEDIILVYHFSAFK